MKKLLWHLMDANKAVFPNILGLSIFEVKVFDERIIRAESIRLSLSFLAEMAFSSVYI